MFLFLHTHPIQYFAPLYRYLHSRGVALEVWYMDNGGHRDAEFGQQVVWDIDLLEGYPNRFFPNKGYGQSRGQRGRGAYNNPALLEALRLHAPATVVVHGWSYDTYIRVLQKAGDWGHRLFFRGETNLPMELARPRWQQMARRILLGWLLRHCHQYCAIGQHSQAFYRWLGIPANRIVFTPYAVDNERYRLAARQHTPVEARQQAGWPQQSFLFLYSGKFIPKKRPLDILQAFARLSPGSASLVMVGDGPLRPAMEQFISNHGLEKQVVLAGFINQQQMPLAYRAADCLVMASDYGETWGLSVNEAMNAGLPLIISDRVGCYPDLLQEGKNGFGYPCGDIQLLTAAMQRMLAITPQQRYEMGAASLRLVADYDFEAVEKGLLS